MPECCIVGMTKCAKDVFRKCGICAFSDTEISPHVDEELSRRGAAEAAVAVVRSNRSWCSSECMLFDKIPVFGPTGAAAGRSRRGASVSRLAMAPMSARRNQGPSVEGRETANGAKERRLPPKAETANRTVRGRRGPPVGSGRDVLLAESGTGGRAHSRVDAIGIKTAAGIQYAHLSHSRRL